MRVLITSRKPMSADYIKGYSDISSMEDLTTIARFGAINAELYIDDICIVKNCALTDEYYQLKAEILETILQK